MTAGQHGLAGVPVTGRWPLAAPPSPFELFTPGQLLAAGIALLLFGLAVLVAETLTAHLGVTPRAATVLAVVVLVLAYRSVQSTPVLADAYAVVGLVVAAGLPAVTVVSLLRGVLSP